jgi:hypothetical protein
LNQLLMSDSGLSRWASGVGLKMTLPRLSYGTLSGESDWASSNRPLSRPMFCKLRT